MSSGRKCYVEQQRDVKGTEVLPGGSYSFHGQTRRASDVIFERRPEEVTVRAVWIPGAQYSGWREEQS